MVLTIAFHTTIPGGINGTNCFEHCLIHPKERSGHLVPQNQPGNDFDGTE